MMGFRKIWVQHLDATAGELHALKKKITRDGLHDFRISIKKLKALLHLLNAGLAGEHQLQLGAGIQSVYHLTGALRNLQLHAERIKKRFDQQAYVQPSSYLAMLDVRMLTCMEALERELKSFSIHDFHTSMMRQVHAIEFMDGRAYLLSMKKRLSILLFPMVITDEGLHEVRKVVKDLHYNRNLLGPELAVVLPFIFHGPEKAEQLANTLGNFHDLCVSLELLQSAHLEQLEPGERNMLLHTREELMAEKQQIRQELTPVYLKHLFELR